MIPSIETDRLILREMLPEDDEALFAMDSDPEVHKFLGNKPVTDMEDCRKTIEQLRKQYVENGIGRWAVIEKSSGQFVGWSGIKYFKDSVNNHDRFYEVGYRFNRASWG